MNFNQILFIIYVCFIALLSIITFFLFKKDKKLAETGKGKMRIKEKTLLGFTAFGGSFGALLSSKIYHHKTDKSYFTFTILISLLVQLIVLGVLLYMAFFGA